MLQISPAAVLVATCLSAVPLAAQQRPDLSGVWRLDLAQSRMIGGTPSAASGYQLTWLVNHRDPDIAVVVNVRDERGSTEYTFTCTTDRQQCVNELTTLREGRRMTAWWDGYVLRMSQQVTSPAGGFTADDRLFLAEEGEQLVFERVVTNANGDRPVRQVFRKLGPHPSQRQAPDPLPSVELPPELARVLRDYERHWHAGRADSLVALFTEDGFIARRGGWVRGTAALREGLQRTSSDLRLRAVAYSVALREGLQRTSSDLRLRAVAYSVDGVVAYIIGNYGYGTDQGIPDRGMFVLTLRRGNGGRWLISADLDGAIRP